MMSSLNIETEEYNTVWHTEVPTIRSHQEIIE